MSTVVLTIYVLIWPVIASGVMLLLTVSVWRDMRQAKKEGVSMV